MEFSEMFIRFVFAREMLSSWIFPRLFELAERFQQQRSRLKGKTRMRRNCVAMWLWWKSLISALKSIVHRGGGSWRNMTLTFNYFSLLICSSHLWHIICTHTALCQQKLMLESFFLSFFGQQSEQCAIFLLQTKFIMSVETSLTYSLRNTGIIALSCEEQPSESWGVVFT